MSLFACYVVSKLKRHRCPTFGALRLRTRRVQTGRYIFIYIDVEESRPVGIVRSRTQTMGFSFVVLCRRK
jgi:hypothetical protein